MKNNKNFKVASIFFNIHLLVLYYMFNRKFSDALNFVMSVYFYELVQGFHYTYITTLMKKLNIQFFPIRVTKAF